MTLTFLRAEVSRLEEQRNEADRRASVMQSRFDEAMTQVERFTRERDEEHEARVTAERSLDKAAHYAYNRARTAILDEVSYRWERRNEAGKPFGDWLWEWTLQARDEASK